MKKIVISFSFAIALLIAGLSFNFPAIATTQNYEWHGNKGYTVKATFDYREPEESNQIIEKGAGKTKQLNSLTATFYDPNGEIIRTYNNVVDGVSKANYFQLSFDPKLKQLLGNIDLGGEVAGDIYLKGEIDRHLSLIEVAPNGEEQIIDRD